MNPADSDITPNPYTARFGRGDLFDITPNPYTARFGRGDLDAKVSACIAAGQDPSFYVGVLSRMDAYEATLSSSPRAAPSGPVLKGPSPV